MIGRELVLRFAASCARCGRRLSAGARARVAGTHGQIAHLVSCGPLTNRAHRDFERRTRGGSTR